MFRDVDGDEGTTTDDTAGGATSGYPLAMVSLNSAVTSLAVNSVL